MLLRPFWPPFRRFNLQSWAGLDWWLLGLPIGLTFLAGLLIRSTQQNADYADWWQHWVTGGVGIALVFWLARCRYQTFFQLRWVIYGVTIASLLAVDLFGTTALGAQRWISIGGFNVQPSEFAKLGMIIVLAGFLSQNTADRLGVLLQALGIMAVPWFLVFAEPNLGTSLVFGAIALGMLYWANAKPAWLVMLLSPLLSGILFGLFKPGWAVWLGLIGYLGWRSFPWRWLGGGIALLVNLVAGAGVGWAWQHVLHDYQRDRLILFLDPSKDPLGGGYHLIQSRIAIGAGGLWGQGLNHGTQTQLRFIPEQHTDFIFTALGEELGFIGCVLVLLAFWLICWRLIVIAQTAKDNFASLLAIGVFSMLIFQVLINVAMTVGLGPVTGIPLPWLSYGRSALLMNFMAIGVVEAVAMRRYRLRF
jgi:rod shape determining protein RodA